jgi:hypothetical protein
MYSGLMSEMRTAKITVLLTPSALERLDSYRAPRRWTRSTAIAALVEEGLSAQPGDSDTAKEAQ